MTFQVLSQVLLSIGFFQNGKLTLLAGINFKYYYNGEFWGVHHQRVKVENPRIDGGSIGQTEEINLEAIRLDYLGICVNLFKISTAVMTRLKFSLVNKIIIYSTKRSFVTFYLQSLLAGFNSRRLNLLKRLSKFASRLNSLRHFI